MKTAMFCFGQFHFLLAVGDMLEQNVFIIPDLDHLVDIRIRLRFQSILKYFYIHYQYLHSQPIYPQMYRLMLDKELGG